MGRWWRNVVEPRPRAARASDVRSNQPSWLHGTFSPSGGMLASYTRVAGCSWLSATRVYAMRRLAPPMAPLPFHMISTNTSGPCSPERWPSG
jgi:hypothetical protein